MLSDKPVAGPLGAQASMGDYGGDGDPVQREMIMGALIWAHVHTKGTLFLIKNKRLCLWGPRLGSFGQQTEGWGQ